jgi:hypothetical protein
MMFTLRYVLVVALCIFSCVGALQVPAIQRTSRVSSLPQSFLHPSQASELEACALALTMEFLEEQRRKKEETSLAFEYNSPADPHAMEVAPFGPVSWCRRRLSTAAKQLKNLKP